MQLPALAGFVGGQQGAGEQALGGGTLSLVSVGDRDGRSAPAARRPSLEDRLRQFDGDVDGVAAGEAGVAEAGTAGARR